MWRCGSKREKKDDSLGVGVLDEPKVDLSRQWGGELSVNHIKFEMSVRSIKDVKQ